MRVNVKLFAQLRDMAGSGDIQCDVPEAARVSDVWQALAAAHPALAPFESSVSCAVNAEYVKRQAMVHAGDEVAFLPPVSGG
jgi:molybdopterin converting factor subunit 1